LLGTVIVTLIYILANVAYLSLLPFHGSPDATDIMGRGIQFAQNDRVGVAAATMIFGGVATIVMAVLCMISTFGCNNGIILASARVYQTMSEDGLFFEKMKVNNEKKVPAFALWAQCIWISILCLSGKYNTLLNFVMFGVMLFYILTIAGVFILRKKQPDAPRPYKTLGYPILPGLYILLASLFCFNLLFTQSSTSIIGLGIILSGIPIYYFWNKKKTHSVNHA
jgi:APA family basic amino acid/polyamine antiporter